MKTTQRQIKFRGWNLATKNMVIPPTIGNPASEPLGENTGTILMQFTGLLDKNGKEIYEQDIVKYKGMKTPQLIGFGSGRYCFVYDTGEPMRNITPNEMLKMEIIGNIYENKELLK